MNTRQLESTKTLYLILGAMFIAALVASNLIFQKFFYWEPFGWFRFELSVGILPYPITFLITDLISEIYGQKKANKVVIAGIAASFFSMGILLVADAVPAMDSSPVSDETFRGVFGLSPIAVLASMLAYLFAQFIDIRIYHFWKNYTQGKKLWLRNNLSTFSSQFIDTFTVVSLLTLFEVLPSELYWTLILSGVLFKILVAALDTPLLYALVYIVRKRFGLGLMDELKI
ncbi:queuosine precursor transporter [Flavobacteriaceae bacterium]|nr:queuosine precursor transporter [Flavobacteriaceae bacterium]